MSHPLPAVRAAIALFAISLPVLVADLVMIYVVGGHPALGKLLGIVGALGVLGSVWLVRRPAAR